MPSRCRPTTRKCRCQVPASRRSAKDSAMLRRSACIVALTAQAVVLAQAPAPRETQPSITILRPARVFDGESIHEGWLVRVQGDRIQSAGPAANIAMSGAAVVDLPGLTLLPGLVEGHSHVLLHPYDETSWNDQVLHESIGVRT